MAHRLQQMAQDENLHDQKRSRPFTVTGRCDLRFDDATPVSAMAEIDGPFEGIFGKRQTLVLIRAAVEAGAVYGRSIRRLSKFFALGGRQNEILEIPRHNSLSADINLYSNLAMKDRRRDGQQRVPRRSLEFCAQHEGLSRQEVRTPFQHSLALAE
ncbi:hypothetical protein EJ06DRAFT_519800 [Trichodelitschia bisporula]|uniref:Uncharacterized protein n=1 Tax=Trichodelitschia bisporula TaxID=703511 RepID=A0A6G1I3A2_9PEZI|nr:hypothetical protein EJ06DRAFT_519800 [Trichodelitschia bisporula]